MCPRYRCRLIHAPREEVRHPRQEGRLRADGRYELRVPFTDPTELAMDILRHGDSVSVLGDKPLVALIRERLARAAAQYASAPGKEQR